MSILTTNHAQNVNYVERTEWNSVINVDSKESSWKSSWEIMLYDFFSLSCKLPQFSQT